MTEYKINPLWLVTGICLGIASDWWWHEPDLVGFYLGLPLGMLIMWANYRFSVPKLRIETDT